MGALLHRGRLVGKPLPGFFYLGIVRVQPQVGAHSFRQRRASVVAGVAIAQQGQQQGAGLGRCVGSGVIEEPYGVAFPLITLNTK